MSDRPVPGGSPHFVQIGDTPVFVGRGAGDLVCRCGDSVLVSGHPPGSLLAIDIACGVCGAVTTTPVLGDADVPPVNAQLVERDKRPVPTSILLADDMVLGDRDMLVGRQALTQPRPVPSVSLELSPATLTALAAAYDRISGGHLAADREAMRPDRADLTARLPSLPLAWAFEQVAPNIDSPGWWCLAEEPDAVAAKHLAAFQQFIAAWSHHPLFDAMGASVAAGGFSTHAFAVFAAAQSLAAAGNHVGFTRPAPGQTVMDGFYLQTSPTERLPIVVRRFDRFDWPAKQTPDAAAVRAAAIDAMIASQGRINVRQPGMLVLSVGSVHRQMDPALITGLSQTLGERWKKHRGLVGAALVLPKIFPTDRSDHVTFGWTFLPDANPHYAGGLVRAVPRPATNVSAR